MYRGDHISQVPAQAGWILECSESVGMDCASSNHSSTGVRLVYLMCGSQTQSGLPADPQMHILVILLFLPRLGSTHMGRA